MCRHGTYYDVSIINPNQNKVTALVDACIAPEIQRLNNLGIVTLGCCCGHGKAGEIVEYENGFGKWKTRHDPAHVLIDEQSVGNVKELGYQPFPYYYADGEQNGIWQMYLKTGCVTHEDVEEWHHENE